MLSASLAVDMAALQGFVELLNRCTYKVKVFILCLAEMRITRIKAAKKIFMLCKKRGLLHNYAKFQEHVIDVSNINDEVLLYKGFIVIMPVASVYLQRDRKNSSCRCLQL